MFLNLSLWLFHFVISCKVADEPTQQRYGCLILAVSGTYACISPLLGWISSNASEYTSVVGLVIALNVSFTAPGQILGVWIYNGSDTRTGYTSGHWINASLLLLIALISVLLRLYYARANRQRVGPAGARPFVY
jgi:predicted MFS family arabinose efflux permease